MKKTLYGILSIIIIILIVVLSSYSADIKAYSWRTKLVQAINTNDIDKVEELLQVPGMDINRDGNIFLQFVFGSEVAAQTPFEAALYSNDLEMLQMVLSYDGIVLFCEEENPVGWILSSVSDGDWQQRHEIVKFMLAKGLDPDVIVNDGSATLCCIAGESLIIDNEDNVDRAQGILNLYQATIELCKNKQQKDKDTGTTPMHWAVNSGNQDLAEYLIEELGYTIDEKNYNQETPIIFLFKDCYKPYMDENLTEKTVRFCIEQGADLSAKDVDGNTAYDYAKQAGFIEIAELLDPND